MIDIHPILASDIEDIAPVVIIVAIVIINAVAAIFKKAKEGMEKKKAEYDSQASPKAGDVKGISEPSQNQPRPKPARPKPSKAVQSIAQFFGLDELVEPEIVAELPAPKPKAKKRSSLSQGHTIAMPHEHTDGHHRLVENSRETATADTTAPSRWAKILQSPTAAQEAFIASEIFAAPKALRDDEPSWS